jgi:hypothetical protein
MSNTRALATATKLLPGCRNEGRKGGSEMSMHERAEMRRGNKHRAKEGKPPFNAQRVPLQTGHEEHRRRRDEGITGAMPANLYVFRGQELVNGKWEDIRHSDGGLHEVIITRYGMNTLNWLCVDGFRWIPVTEYPCPRPVSKESV